MKKTIIITPEASEDLDHHFAYISKDNLDAATRFLDAAQQAFETLSGMPEIVSPREFKNPHLTGIRVWPVPGFRKHLIFYQVIDKRVWILRVLQASRDIPGFLEEEWRIGMFTC